MGWLTKVRREKELELQQGTVRHAGYNCDRCKMAPILGTRWTCYTCARLGDQVDFCCDCAPTGVVLGNHTADHRLRPIRKEKRSASQDSDYTSSSSSYLDTNYFNV